MIDPSDDPLAIEVDWCPPENEKKAKEKPVVGGEPEYQAEIWLETKTKKVTLEDTFSAATYLTAIEDRFRSDIVADTMKKLRLDVTVKLNTFYEAKGFDSIDIKQHIIPAYEFKINRVSDKLNVKYICEALPRTEVLIWVVNDVDYTLRSSEDLEKKTPKF